MQVIQIDGVMGLFWYDLWVHKAHPHLPQLANNQTNQILPEFEPKLHRFEADEARSPPSSRNRFLELSSLLSPTQCRFDTTWGSRYACIQAPESFQVEMEAYREKTIQRQREGRNRGLTICIIKSLKAFGLYYTKYTLEKWAAEH